MLNAVALLVALTSADIIIVSDMANQTLTTHTGCEVTGFSLTPNDKETSLLLASCEAFTSRKTKLAPAQFYSAFSYVGAGDFNSTQCNLVGTWKDSVTTYAFQCFQSDPHN